MVLGIIDRYLRRILSGILPVAEIGILYLTIHIGSVMDYFDIFM